ncbi:phage tail tube protein [Streptomyces sp. EKS3.2]|uniref:phage tail tube protein n=1 Tax=Streptomyces sp. EKS3.2 TaxID=3461008 RepID=UPI004040FCD9
MANDAKKIRFAPNGSIYVAPAAESLTVPTDLGTAETPPTGYKALGYVDEGGVTLTPAIETQPVNAWQSATAVLYNVTSASFSVKATLQETNEVTTELFWGAQWVEIMSTDPTPVGTGVFKLDLSSTPELKEISLVVDWNQGSIRNRVVIPRAMISDRGAIQLSRTENGKFELTIEALDSAGKLGYVLTNDDIVEGP